MTLSTKTLQKLGKTIQQWKRPILLTHARADGDALGSLVAMRSVFRTFGADPLALTFDPPSPKYKLLVEDEPLPIWSETTAKNDLLAADGVLVMDTCTYSQLEPAAEWLRTVKNAPNIPILAVDHHVTRDELADHYLIDDSSAAVCVILYEWARACDWSLDAAAVQALFVGIATDTGWFRFSSTSARTLEIAADLVQRGIVPDYVYGRLFQAESAARIKLFGAALDAIELYHKDRLAIVPISADMFRRTGATPADTEDLINEPLRIETIEVAVLLADAGDGIIKASFRSKGVDVAAAAQRFGGGGHVRAAGARITGTLRDVKKQIVKEFLPPEG